eukprot:scaffold304697_cov13-Tisochrysis_lutea.AAC.1
MPSWLLRYTYGYVSIASAFTSTTSEVAKHAPRKQAERACFWISSGGGRIAAKSGPFIFTPE